MGRKLPKLLNHLRLGKHYPHHHYRSQSILSHPRHPRSRYQHLEQPPSIPAPTPLSSPRKMRLARSCHSTPRSTIFVQSHLLVVDVVVQAEAEVADPPRRLPDPEDPAGMLPPRVLCLNQAAVAGCGDLHRGICRDRHLGKDKDRDRRFARPLNSPIQDNPSLARIRSCTRA